MSTTAQRRDRKLLAWMFGGVVLLIAGASVLAPRRTEQDPRPSTDNTGSRGAKAVFLTLQTMGRTAVSWDEPADRLPLLDPQKTTLVLAEPNVALADRDRLAAKLKEFLERGGRVLLAGSGAAAGLLPEGKTVPAGQFMPGLCETVPEGTGPLAAPGSVEMAFEGSWAAEGPQFRVEQRCTTSPVVVRFPVGAGEAVWWASVTPLTNAGLKRDGNLKLLLASVGAGRDVYFDEYYFGQHETASPLSADKRALWTIFWQFVLLFALVVWSFSRRKGPLRMPVTVPRSSPVEFAQSMGGLYAKARATEPVAEAAQRRLERLLASEAGLSWETVRNAPEAVAEALTARFGGDWSALRRHLEDARSAKGSPLSPGDALALVRSIADDEERLRAMLTPGVRTRAEIVEEPVSV